MEQKLTVKIDIDIKSDKFIDIIRKRTCVFKMFRLRVVDVRVCSTKKGYHIYIECINEMENVHYVYRDISFIQLALGDDYKRACYNYIRGLHIDDMTSNILFTKKYNGKGELISEEVYDEEKTNELKRALNEEGVMLHENGGGV